MRTMEEVAVELDLFEVCKIEGWESACASRHVRKCLSCSARTLNKKVNKHRMETQAGIEFQEGKRTQ